jgi:hypothetical protein
VKKFNNQKGFSAVAVLLAAAVLAVVAGGGYVVFQHNKTKPTSAASSQSSNSSSPSASPSTNPPGPTAAYLNIKEWGIKIPLTAPIKDAYYTVQGSSIGSDKLPNTAWLGLASLNGAHGCDISQTGPTKTNLPIGAILRVLPTDTDPVSGKLYNQLDPNGTTINGFYYTYKSFVNNNCASQSSLKSINASFSTAAGNAVIDTTAN